MGKESYRNIKNFIKAVSEQNQGLLATYLFGSFSRGVQNMDSDIDVALIFENLDDREKFDKQIQLMILSSRFDSRIEPHPLSEKDFLSSNPFVAEIKKTGKELSPTSFSLEDGRK